MGLHRSGRVAWGLLVFLGLLAALAALAERWSRDASAHGFGWIEPDRLRLLPPAVIGDETGAATAPWLDSRWSEEAARVLAALPDFHADDGPARLHVARVLAGLSFVETAAVPEVVWPDGLRVPIRLRQPVACVRVGDDFQTVDSSGVLLSGRWDAPPRRDGGWLPVVRLDGDETGLLDVDLDAGLVIARSFWGEVERSEREAFGRFVIDTAPARGGNWESGGVQLVFEDGRSALFGRPPGGGAGELPAAQKWTALIEALALLPPLGDVDWERVDVRWDRPGLELRAEGVR